MQIPLIFMFSVESNMKSNYNKRKDDVKDIIKIKIKRVWKSLLWFQA